MKKKLSGWTADLGVSVRGGKGMAHQSEFLTGSLKGGGSLLGGKGVQSDALGRAVGRRRKSLELKRRERGERDRNWHKGFNKRGEGEKEELGWL